MDATSPTPRFRSILPLLLVPILTRAQPEAAAPSTLEVLGEESFWRFHAAWRTPATAADGKYDLGGGHVVGESGTRWIRSSFTHPTPPPPADWTEVDFDDSGWARHGGPPFSGYGHGPEAEVYILCGRLRFRAADPARARRVRLDVVYRGGVVVYLNGKELGRNHLPRGPLEPLTLASDYPAQASFGPDNEPLKAPSKRGPPEDLVPFYEKRFRQFHIDIPPQRLRRGINVLAIEVHRAALPAPHLSDADMDGWNPRLGKQAWGTCGVERISLTAPRDSGLIAQSDSVPDLQIWGCNTLLRPGVDFDRGDPLEPMRAVRLAAPRRGVSSAQVVISSVADLRGVRARLTSLISDSGVSIDPGCVEVRYATSAERIPQLRAEPPTPTSILPVWLTARVPADAEPGTYRGQLAIDGLPEPATAGVHLTVYDWTLPDLRDYRTSVTLLHCPEAIARHYDVPLWSDEHFQLLEPSMALMGYGGNCLLSVSAIRADYFGDHPLIVFREERDGYFPDFRFVRRYLRLYDQNAIPPRFLSVQVWNYSISRRGFGRDGGDEKWITDTIKILRLEGDELVAADVPVYSRPGTEAMWAAVADGMKQILKDLDWRKTRLLWGTGGDNLPTAEIVSFFKKIAPDVHWRVATHGGSVRNWGPTVEERTQPGGLVVGHASLVRRNITRRPLVKGCPLEVIKRDGVTSVATDYLTMAPLGRIAAHYAGTALLAFDYWPVLTISGRRRTPMGAYVEFGNIHASGGAFVAPGPDGAAPSPQLEAFREGLQLTEAILRLQDLLEAPPQRASAPESTVAEAKKTIQVLMDVMESNRRIRPAGVADVWPYIRRVYELISTIEAATRP